jgi:hypothetical protein
MHGLLTRFRAYTRLGWLTLKGRLMAHTPLHWHSPEELIRIGYTRSRVVMINEAHNGWLRCVRTRTIGQRILPVAHELGVRYLAMEALWPPFAAEANRTRQLPDITQSYLAQPEMRAFLHTALTLDWTLIPYEADIQHEPPALSHQQSVNWREEQQARNLIAALNALPAESKLLVWCGNGHHSKRILGDWVPMGYQFQRLSSIESFVIDQIVTVKFGPQQWAYAAGLVARFERNLAAYDGTAGVLVAEHPMFVHHEGSDAILLSLDNDME